MTFGERVQRLREKLEMNQKELAEASDITQATISRIEDGKVRQLKSEALRRLAEALGVTVDYLIGKTDKLEPDEIVEADPEARTLFRGYERLTKSGRKQVADFAKFLEQQERRKKRESE